MRNIQGQYEEPTFEFSHFLIMLGLIAFCLAFWGIIIWLAMALWELCSPYLSALGA